MAKALVILDDGHGMDTPGKRTPPMPGTGKPTLENEFNRLVVDKLDKLFTSCGFGVLQTAPEINDVSLDIRTSRANRAYTQFKKVNPGGICVFVSIHYNAHKDTFEASNAEGVETFHYPGSTEGSILAKAIHTELMGGTPQKDRGVKSANFHVLRETLMPSVLVEAGFMDHLPEAKLMLDPAFQNEVALEVYEGVRKYLARKGVSTMSKDAASDWAKGAQDWAIKTGLSDGTRPKDTVTREELWAIAQRVQENTIKSIVEALAKR
jgi:N-acetylmuramoyl-L-alanine amidase